MKAAILCPICGGTVDMGKQNGSCSGCDRTEIISLYQNLFETSFSREDYQECEHCGEMVLDCDSNDQYYCLSCGYVSGK